MLYSRSANDATSRLSDKWIFTRWTKIYAYGVSYLSRYRQENSMCIHSHHRVCTLMPYHFAGLFGTYCLNIKRPFHKCNPSSSMHKAWTHVQRWWVRLLHMYKFLLQHIHNFSKLEQSIVSRANSFSLHAVVIEMQKIKKQKIYIETKKLGEDL